MSTEDTPEDLTEETSDHADAPTRRKRRSPLAIATVAAAVLVVGGGGAYWASSAADDDDPGQSSNTGNLPPLALDGFADPAQTGFPGERGIAVGEPNPGRPTYRATGELPGAPDPTAPVYRTAPKVSRAEVAKLAKALRITGEPRLERGVWKVGGAPERMSPTLRVKATGAGGWSYTRFGAPGGDGCLEPPHTMGEGADDGATAEQARPSGPRCGSLRDGRPGGGLKDAGRSRDAQGPDGSQGGQDTPAIPDGGSPPVSAAEAEKAAEPVLEALGQDEAAVDASRTYGAVRAVTADPVIDGLPSYGWQTTLEIGANGQVDGANGFLADLTASDPYPVVGAEQALRALNAGSGQHGKADIGGCKTAKDPDVVVSEESTDKTSAPERHKAPCEPAAGKQPVVQEVQKATFGLGMRFTEGRQVLVPSWIFTVRAADAKDGESDTVVTQPAVDPKYLVAPTSSRAGGWHPERTESYEVRGKELTVRFAAGVCSTFSATADTSESTVKVRVTSKRTHPERPCVSMAKNYERKITLDEPLEDRKVVDATTGKTVPREPASK
ncbi:hypothetical protein AAHZ94_29445 [Streptomyces sp. HSW2009]|uniref:hypothetical protein n=1 Tax=Streptomyces sp. HSW2009 TaxID=3142890 RepID=UPI0032EDA853